MRTQRPSSRESLWHAVGGAEAAANRFLLGLTRKVGLADAVHGSVFGGRSEELRGRSVLVTTADQLTAALTLIELDGVARRLVLYPPDLPLDHIPFVIDCASVDAIVSDQTAPGTDTRGVEVFVAGDLKAASAGCDRSAPCQTEWILLTSGTTGMPKLVVHTLASLAGAIGYANSESPVVWSTFYDIRRYGGLQIFLRGILTGASLVLSSAKESTADFLARAAAHGITHISGTPSHWRRARMSPSAHMITPQYVRLSGEIADQGILSNLQSFYPQAKVAHAFASTEAGVAFDVADGLAGFPETMIGVRGDVEMKIEDGSLRIRSTRIADRYLGENAPPLTTPDGFVDTRDMVELRGGRYYFVGRRDGVINVGGLKVHPEEVEVVINRHADVQMSLVRTRKNPITGAVVIADIVLKTALESSEANARDLRSEILLLCREELPSHKVPALINFVPALAVAETGKLVRQHA
jgi:acyl-coenzyme A synthetase/AMP-(fatty) acid ligase